MAGFFHILCLSVSQPFCPGGGEGGSPCDHHPSCIGPHCTRIPTTWDLRTPSSTSDIWWKSLKTCSNLFIWRPNPMSTDIWWPPLKHDSWQAGGMHPTGILFCLLLYNLYNCFAWTVSIATVFTSYEIWWIFCHFSIQSSLNLMWLHHFSVILLIHSVLFQNNTIWNDRDFSHHFIVPFPVVVLNCSLLVLRLIHSYRQRLYFRK